MSAFDWTVQGQLPERERYPERVGDFPTRGLGAWKALWDRLLQLTQDVDVFDDAAQDVWDEAFQEFLTAAARDPRPPEGVLSCCVFVSHRQIDWPYAERIAYLAAQRGMLYWLDVHDPALAAANAASMPSPAKEVLIASMIEMGLLNSTHVIACHTANSSGSKWIPYELGRVKQRRLFSTRACGWFDPSGAPPVAGDYTYLAARTNSDAGVDRWLTRQTARPGPCRTYAPYWKKSSKPRSLPK